MKKYKKKPVVVEAIQLSAENRQAIADWIGRSKFTRAGAWFYESNGDDELYIGALEGTMAATGGDYIIKGIKGEFYPCKPGIFEATYEEVK